MYILIMIGGNDTRTPWKVSKRKNKLEKYLKEKGYFFSKKYNRYINKGIGIDYKINYIDEI